MYRVIDIAIVQFFNLYCSTAVLCAVDYFNLSHKIVLITNQIAKRVSESKHKR